MKIIDIYATYDNNNIFEKSGAVLENGTEICITESDYLKLKSLKKNFGIYGYEYDETRKLLIQNFEQQLKEHLSDKLNKLSIENDQTAKADAGKPRLTLVPRQIIWDIAKVREFAVNGKYRDPDNWRRVSVERYRDALLRHVMRYLDDPHGVDDESGLPHLSHIATNVAFLCELEKNEVDNSKE